MYFLGGGNGTRRLWYATALDDDRRIGQGKKNEEKDHCAASFQDRSAVEHRRQDPLSQAKSKERQD